MGKKTKMVRIMNDTTFSRFFEVREYDSGVISMICVQILGILSKNDCVINGPRGDKTLPPLKFKL